MRVVWALMCAAVMYGQSPAGEIHIEVKDPSGAGMKASGKLADRTFQTDAQGTYTFPNLPFGRYRLEVSTTGFVTQSMNVDVQSETPILRTVMMALAQAPASKVDVIATTPLEGVGLPVDQIPAPVQQATQVDIDRSGAVDLSGFMNRRLNGVHVNEMQGNPFQPDVNYRGYTASPLLGTPQGISVFMDGVRQNQPFGDVVSWDLIPRNAISEITLLPGSNPVFGLNTLGGALSIQTKDGVRNPGLSGNLTYGSSGRKALQAEDGGGGPTGFNWFLSANAFHESGWRYDSPSDVRQGFAKLGWRTANTDVALTSIYAYNTLIGNGLQDFRLLAANYSSVYTVPDTTANRSPSFNLRAQHTVSSALTLAGNTWYRNIRTEGINGNANANSFDQPVYQPTASEQAALSAAGYSGFPASGASAANTPFPKWRCIANALQRNEPNATCDAITVYSKEVQNEYGLSGQMTWFTSPFPKSSGHNQFTAGAAFDRGSIGFTQNTQFGYLNPDRSITGVQAWQDGSTNQEGAPAGTPAGTPVDTRVNLHGTTPNGSLFATDTLSVGNAWHFTLSGRYNRSYINNRDLINPIAGPGSLDANDVFGRFNPSMGATYSPNTMLNFYANYSQGSRAPTSIELGCADPANPCSLPNALASDPPLKQVVTSTWEAGLRGKFEEHLNWNVDTFRAANTNDILFIASQQTGSGYFKNFGKTQRQGIQASVDAHIKRISGGIDYTFLEATYQSTETVDGTANNTNDQALSGLPGIGGVITIHPGNRIPLIPKQTGKVFADFQAAKKLMFDLGMVAASSSYARGNENNAYQADGTYYLGSGVSGGYAVVNLAAHYDLNRWLQLAVQVDNLLDRHYATAAQLANTGLTSQGTFIARPFPALPTGDFPVQSVEFVAPGAPRRAWVELRLRF